MLKRLFKLWILIGILIFGLIIYGGYFVYTKVRDHKITKAVVEYDVGHVVKDKFSGLKDDLLDKFDDLSDKVSGK